MVIYDALLILSLYEQGMTVINNNTNLTTLTVTGAKAQEFLQGQVTCDMRTLSQQGAFSLAALCDHRGRMIANFWVVHWHHDFLLVLHNSLSQTVITHLQKYAVFSKVAILENKAFRIASISNSAVALASDEALKHDDVICIILPNKNRKLLIAKNFPDCYTINPCFQKESAAEFTKRNIEDGLVILCDKTSLLFTPQMINLEKLDGVSFTKGCYVGQEIVARTHYLGKLKKHMHRLQLQSDHPLNPGDEINNGIIAEAISLSKNNYDVLAVMQD